MNYIQALPQKPPFRFVEKVVHAEYAVSAEGRMTFAPEHPVFDGHLPGDPIVPGVILIEALAQLSGIVLIPPGSATAMGYLAEVKRVRFRRLVRPEECITLESKLIRKLGSAASFEVSASVDGEEAAGGELVVGGMR